MPSDIDQAKQILRDEIRQLRRQSQDIRERMREARKRLRRLEGKKTLGEYIVEVLKSTNEPLTAKEIAAFVQEAGYKFKGDKNIPTVILYCLRHDSRFRRASRPRSRPVRYVVDG